jgi:parallel beta-helix repeat protein
VTYSGTAKFVVESAVSNLKTLGGGTVTFEAGIFDLGTEFFKLRQISNIVFEGQGIDVTTIRNSTSVSADTEPFNFSGAYFVTIRDLTVSAGGATRTTSDAIDFDQGNDSLVERVKVVASRGKGIIFDGKGTGWTANRNVVRDCVINGVPNDGVQFLAASNNRVEGCTITNTGGDGVEATKSSTSAPQPNKKSNDNVITGNVIDNSGENGVKINSSDRNLVSGNTITNSSDDVSSRDGIRVGAADSISCNDSVVELNTATDNQAVKTQKYGLNISSSLCNRTVVGTNDFTGNRVGAINDVGTGTKYVSSDTQDPTVPGNVTATPVSPVRVDLSWSASTDNVGVTGYTIYRDGVQIATVGSSVTSFQDTTVVPSTTYLYTVDAFDAAGNHSAQSAPPASATTPSDKQAPTVPGGVTATPISSSRVDLSWSASTDNIAVAGYTIYRDGVAIDTAGGAATGFQDTSVAPGTTYLYTVDAFDAAQNHSAQSAPPASATTPAAPSSLTFGAAGDSYVDASTPATNFGTSTTLRIDGDPIRKAYLRFDVQGVTGTVKKATLRIFANSSSSVGHQVGGVSDNTWSETGITFNNAPAIGSSVGSSGPFSSGAYIEVDVTPLVTGNGLVSFGVTTPHTTAISYGSRQSTTPPELVVDFS